MKIAIIGKVDPTLTFEEWERMLHRHINAATVTGINLTDGNDILYRYAKRYATNNNLLVTEFPDCRKLTDNSDLLVAFMLRDTLNNSIIPNESPNEANKTVSDKKAIIIYYYKKGEPMTDNENKLIRQIRQGENDVETAKEQLIKSKQTLVRNIADQYVSINNPLETLIVEGNKGLEEAIYNFDETCGFSFSAYALGYIRKYVKSYAASDCDRDIDIMKFMEEDENKTEQALNKLHNRECEILKMTYGIGCTALSDEEIMNHFDLTPQRLHGIRSRAKRHFEIYFRQTLA